MTEGFKVRIGLSSFKDVPLCELTMEEALKSGIKKSADLKQADFLDTSIRFCVPGLRDWYSSYVHNYCDMALYSVFRNIVWQWASFCETDTTFKKVRDEFNALQRGIVESTTYTDLADKMRDVVRIKEFSYGSRIPFNVSLPREAVGIISQSSNALSIPFNSFLQVGYAWSLSTNRNGLYKPWVTSYVKPLLDSVMAHAEDQIVRLGEIRTILLYRDAVGTPVDKKMSDSYPEDQSTIYPD